MRRAFAIKDRKREREREREGEREREKKKIKKRGETAIDLLICRGVTPRYVKSCM